MFHTIDHVLFSISVEVRNMWLWSSLIINLWRLSFTINDDLEKRIHCVFVFLFFSLYFDCWICFAFKYLLVSFVSSRVQIAFFN